MEMVLPQPGQLLAPERISLPQCGQLDLGLAAAGGGAIAESAVPQAAHL
jgi:hypothetical protein